MRVLAIETATSRGSVALVGPEGTIAEARSPQPGGHLEWLAPALRALLETAGLSWRTVDGIAVSIGPGAFTGLRVGVVTAATAAHVADRPLVAVPTLEALAAGVEDAAFVLAALDARRGEVACAFFRTPGAQTGGPHPDRARTDHTPVRLTEDLLLPPHAVAAAHPAPGEPVVVVGDALERHAAALCAALPHTVEADRARWWPSASVVGQLGRARLLRGERDGPIGLVPRYAQRPVARPYAAGAPGPPAGHPEGRARP